MSKKTKKVGIVGRFGPRYGVKARNLIRDIETKKKENSTCPKCQYDAVKRASTGIWKCRHCGYTFAGGAYLPKTSERAVSYISADEEKPEDKEVLPNV